MSQSNTSWISSMNILISVMRICSVFDWHLRTFRGGFQGSVRQMIVIYPPDDRKGHELFDQINTAIIPAFYWKNDGDERGTINIPYRGQVREEYDEVMGYENS